MVKQATIPNTHGTVVASYSSIPYVGQYAGEDYGIFCERFVLPRGVVDLSVLFLPLAPSIVATVTCLQTLQRSHSPCIFTTLKGPVLSANEVGDPRLRLPSPLTMRRRRRNTDGLDGEVELGGTSSTRIRACKRSRTFKGSKGVGLSPTATSIRRARSSSPLLRAVRRCEKLNLSSRMIYSSITPYVHMLYTAADDTDHIELDFTSSNRRGRHRGDYWGGYEGFGVSVAVWPNLHQVG